ncbi:MAG: histidinol-phosphate transaminase [Gammaproteobacteria bacterium]|nr:histidinol-phosphate transaminase [Gammaproteobacteria bacterium]MCF6229336.1 histidinol-phosphate transaminase [Gammaproteobacteria bacterium]
MNSIDNRMKRWIRPEIRALHAYPVPDASGMIKLDAMENPYRWPASMREEWQKLLGATDVNRYPDSGAKALSLRLKQALEVPDGMDIVLGNGSDEIIQMLAMAVAAPGRAIMAPEPGFVMYKMIAGFVAMDYIGVPLKQDFSLDMPAMLAAIEAQQPALIFLAYPNNPTGNMFSEQQVKAIIEAADGLVIVDEAYHAFADHSFMGALGNYPNLLVMRTLSKLGLAGLRLGLLVGPPAWLAEIDKVRLPYNINVLTQVSADFALQHADVFAKQTAAIRADRTLLMVALEEIALLEVFPSAANFILFRVPEGRGNDIFDKLKQSGILIKNLTPQGGLLQDCLRVTVGTPEENQAFIKALTTLL